MGKLAFNHPERLRVDDQTRVQVRIAKTRTADLLEAFTGTGSVQSRDIMVSTLMRVRLVGDDEAFTIVPLSSEDQLILDQEYTEWEWNVTPREAGTHYLYIRVSLRLPIPGHGTEIQDRPVLEQPVEVAVMGEPLAAAAAALGPRLGAVRRLRAGGCAVICCNRL